jgi:hypothetical protein
MAWPRMHVRYLTMLCLNIVALHCAYQLDNELGTAPYGQQEYDYSRVRCHNRQGKNQLPVRSAPASPASLLRTELLVGAGKLAYFCCGDCCLSTFAP